MTGLQVSKFVKVLNEMNERATRSHQVQGELAIAGVLTGSHITGTWNKGTGQVVHKDGHVATVQYSDSATIQSGAFVIRTEKGSSAYQRTHTDHFVYVPFRAGRRHNACVMQIDQLLLVKRKGMQWRNDEARIAVGTMWDHLTVRRGIGLETEFNDDPALGPCTVPRALLLTPSRRKKGYKMAIFIRQIHCPCVFIPDDDGDTFMTISKMGYHGRKDLLYNVCWGQSQQEANDTRDAERFL